jgi:hypothetical protein
VATAGAVELACPLCTDTISVPVTLTVDPARTGNGRAVVTVKAQTVRHRCRRR